MNRHWETGPKICGQNGSSPEVVTHHCQVAISVEPQDMEMHCGKTHGRVKSSFLIFVVISLTCSSRPSMQQTTGNSIPSRLPST